MQRFAIVGGGVTGALLAASLARTGHAVDVYAAGPDPRETGVAATADTVALTARGLQALDDLGLATRVLGDAASVRGRVIHTVDGRLVAPADNPDGSAEIFAASRARLQRALVEGADDYDAVTFHFSHRCTGVDLESGVATLTNATNGETIDTERGTIVVGADGARSAVRERLQNHGRFDFSQRYLPMGAKTLTIPPLPGGGSALDPPDAIHVWPRADRALVTWPNPDDSHTATVYLPLDGELGFGALEAPEQVLGLFERDFGDAVPLMPDLAREFVEQSPRSLMTLRCGPWTLAGRVALVGAACHASAPMYGQELNAALEDVVVFNECIERYSPDTDMALRRYYERRKPDADALEDLAADAFAALFESTASPRGWLRWTGQRWLTRLFPTWYQPAFDQMTFACVPATETRSRTRRQQGIVFGAAAAGALTLVAAVAALI